MKDREIETTEKLLDEATACLQSALNVLPLQYPNHRLWECLRDVMPELRRREKKHSQLAKLCEAIRTGKTDDLDAPLAWAAQIVEQLERATKGKNDGN